MENFLCFFAANRTYSFFCLAKIANGYSKKTKNNNNREKIIQKKSRCDY